MLIDERLSDQSSWQPGDWLQNQVTNQVIKILAHTEMKRPGRYAFAANVIRELNETGIVIVQRIAPDVPVKKHGVPEQEVSKDQQADQQEAQRRQQNEEGRSATSARSI